MELKRVIYVTFEIGESLEQLNKQPEVIPVSSYEELEQLLNNSSKDDRKESLLLVGSKESLRIGESYEVAHLGVGNLSGVAYLIEDVGTMEASYLDRVYRRFHHLPWEITRTKRCILREMTMDDLPELFALYEDSEVTRYMEGLLPYEEEVEKQKAYIVNRYPFYEYGLWMVCDKDTGEIIGRAGLEDRDLGEESVVELGYLIRPDYQGKGYAKEVCQAILDYAWEELGFEEVNCFIEEENLPSVALAKSLGFTYVCAHMEGNRKILRFVQKSNIINH